MLPLGENSHSTSLSQKATFLIYFLKIKFLPLVYQSASRGLSFFGNKVWAAASALRLQRATLADVEKLQRGHAGRVRAALFCSHTG